MLRLPPVIFDKKANRIVSRFVNDRLIELMKKIMLDEVVKDLFDDTISVSVFAENGFNKIMDVDKLIYDVDFAKKISLMYLPYGYSIKKANYNFIGLYKLLKAKGEYVPELAMEYVLDKVIQSAIQDIEDLKDMDWDDILEVDLSFDVEEAQKISTVMKIPEPDRTTVKKAIQSENPDFSEEEVEDTINMYEDLREYINSCFWDKDFLLLDKYTEEQLSGSELNDCMGIMKKDKSNIIKMPQNKSKKSGVVMEYRINPWDLEDE